MTRSGTLVSDDGEKTWDFDAEAMDDSMFRFLRPGQRITFDLVDDQLRNLRIGIA
ncbi:MAG TPA: hypothetical protein VFS18_02745 [Actinomycetota bacterium]|nr:hypothetical protein [Actinomycetota bacterium]